jgi:hypothetical protein
MVVSKTAEQYRSQARRFRVLAYAGVIKGHKKALLEIAAKYDRLAESAATRDQRKADG